MTADPAREWRLRPIHVGRAVAIGLVYLLALVPLSHAPRLSGNVFSRYMTIESIVERHTLRIDGSPLRAQSGSPDVILAHGHWFSDKPPVLSALAAVIYAPLVALGHRFARSPADFLLINHVLVLAVAGLGSAAAVAGLRLALQAAPLARGVADLLALLAGFGSPLLTYAVTFNNHSVAAGLVMVSGVLALDSWRTGSSTRAALAGFLAALAATIDLPVGATWTALLAVALLAHSGWRAGLVFILGTLVPIAFHAILQMRITGSPLPAELTPEVFEFEGSYWLSPEGRWVEPGPRWRWGIEMLLGPNGWLTVMPGLAVGIYGILRASLRRRDPLRVSAWVVGAALLILVGFYSFGVRRTDFAGWSFGTRHLLALVAPVLGFAFVEAARSRRGWLWFVLAPLLVIGAVYAWTGAKDPWSRVERRNDPALIWVKPFTLYPHSSYQR